MHMFVFVTEKFHFLLSELKSAMVFLGLEVNHLLSLFNTLCRPWLIVTSLVLKTLEVLVAPSDSFLTVICSAIFA